MQQARTKGHPAAANGGAAYCLGIDPSAPNRGQRKRRKTHRCDCKARDSIESRVDTYCVIVVNEAHEANFCTLDGSDSSNIKRLHPHQHVACSSALHQQHDVPGSAMINFATAKLDAHKTQSTATTPRQRRPPPSTALSS